MLADHAAIHQFLPYFMYTGIACLSYRNVRQRLLCRSHAQPSHSRVTATFLSDDQVPVLVLIP